MSSISSICVGLLTVLCYNTAPASERMYTCTDSSTKQEVQVKIDKGTPNVITVQGSEYMFVDSNTEGDVQKLWYVSEDHNLVQLRFVMDEYKVHSMKLRTKSFENYTVGTCS